MHSIEFLILILLPQSALMTDSMCIHLIAINRVRVGNRGTESVSQQRHSNCFIQKCISTILSTELLLHILKKEEKNSEEMNEWMRDCVELMISQSEKRIERITENNREQHRKAQNGIWLEEIYERVALYIWQMVFTFFLKWEENQKCQRILNLKSLFSYQISTLLSIFICKTSKG